jgi:hypothetical protein
MNTQLLATYRRLAGRRDMNRRNADAAQWTHDTTQSFATADAYQNAINDLCDAFGVTEDQLRSELTSAATEA